MDFKFQAHGYFLLVALFAHAVVGKHGDVVDAAVLDRQLFARLDVPFSPDVENFLAFVVTPVAVGVLGVIDEVCERNEDSFGRLFLGLPVVGR